ncbi:hypothetical protein [Methylobacterium sp. 1973]
MSDLSASTVARRSSRKPMDGVGPTVRIAVKESVITGNEAQERDNIFLY